jgi:hypothetical protein
MIDAVGKQATFLLGTFHLQVEHTLVPASRSTHAKAIGNMVVTAGSYLQITDYGQNRLRTVGSTNNSTNTIGTRIRLTTVHIPNPANTTQMQRDLLDHLRVLLLRPRATCR